MNFSTIKKNLHKYGLKPIAQREMPLFSWNCVGLGYCRLLRKKMGFSYQAIAIFGEKNKAEFLFNLEYIARKTIKFIIKHTNDLEKVFFQTSQRVFAKTLNKFMLAQKIVAINPEKCLKIITEIYPNNMLSIGMYNCFLRYTVIDENAEMLNKKIIARIASEREKMAKLYPRIELLLTKCVKLIGKKKKFDGDLLKYQTIKETTTFLKKGKVDTKLLKELVKRRKKYFYLYQEKNDTDYITTDSKLISKIKNIFHHNYQKVDKLGGKIAHAGKVTGRVLNLATNNYKNQKNFILVTSMTHPKDFLIIKKSLAIVTDEGGILCHAAIVSREMAKPCIIGTKIATKVLKNGDMVEVDANRGIIKIIDN